MVASDANEMRRQLQRVAVEYPASSWADDALLRLVQLDYASGNLEGAARNLERIRLDYPGSTLLPQASYWAARTYFDQKSPETACRWIADGLNQASGNVELQNQLRYLDQRCAGVRAAIAARSPADSGSQAATGGVDTINITTAEPSPSSSSRDSLPGSPDTARAAVPPPVQPPPATPTHPRAAPAEPAPAPPQPAAPSPGRFRVQVTAVRTAATAEAQVARLRRRGFAPVIYQEAGLYKVRIGDYPTKPAAVAALPELKAKLGGGLFVVAEP